MDQVGGPPADDPISIAIRNCMLRELLRTANEQLIAAEERAQVSEARFDELKSRILTLAEAARAEVAAV